LPRREPAAERSCQPDGSGDVRFRNGTIRAPDGSCGVSTRGFAPCRTAPPATTAGRIRCHHTCRSGPPVSALQPCSGHPRDAGESACQAKEGAAPARATRGMARLGRGVPAWASRRRMTPPRSRWISIASPHSGRTFPSRPVPDPTTPHAGCSDVPHGHIGSGRPECTYTLDTVVWSRQETGTVRYTSCMVMHGDVRWLAACLDPRMIILHQCRLVAELDRSVRSR